MKNILGVIVIITTGALGFMIATPNADSSVPNNYGESMSNIILAERNVFSGLVFESKNGIAITTNRGTFLLKGANLKKLIGKKVLVNGVMRNGAIFAVKIAVRS